jgi:hypothetical protein
MDLTKFIFMHYSSVENFKKSKLKYLFAKIPTSVNLQTWHTYVNHPQ